MARFDRLRVLLAAAGLASCCPEREYPEADVDLSDPTPEMAALLQRCVTYAGDCEPLCQAALELVVPPEEADYWYVLECTLTVEANTSGPTVHIVYDDMSVCGRAPVGLRAARRPAARDEVGAWLADAAHLEAASVVAFTRLAVDLARLGAPRALIEGALRSAREEVVHARLLGALARARGATVERVAVATYEPATLLELALHNASEGCARETVGAAVNAHQAVHAADPEIRAAFAAIAPDEARHAELSWAIDSWARTQLSPAEALLLDIARDRALSRLIESSLSPAAKLVLGLSEIL